MREEEAMAVLVSVPGVSYGQREAALCRMGSAAAVLEDAQACERALGDEGVSAVRRCVKEADRLLDALARDQVRLIMRGGEGYPERLVQIARPPHMLFAWGRADLCDPLPVAIVGTRKASAYGMRHARRIARELAQEGACIVSGLATGIDTAGHQGALDAGGRTIAVLGGALNRFYPAQNRHLMRAILDAGGTVVTEYPMDTPPSRYSFLYRNRIIAGLSLGVLVAEGPQHSGAMRTAQDALDAGRDVFALPGSVESEGSALPHRLIAEGAYLAVCGRDILDVLTGDLRSERPKAPARHPDAGKRPAKERPAENRPAENGAERMIRRAPRCEADSPEAAVLAALAGDEADFDALCEKTGIASDELGALLMMMEMDGLIRALPGLRYAPETGQKLRNKIAK